MQLSDKKLVYLHLIKIKMQLTEQQKVRRDKLQQLRELGIDPFPAEAYEVENTAQDIKDDFKTGKKVKLAGRLMAKRIQGKASFAELQDSTGRMQLYLNRDELCPGDDKALYNTVYKKLIDFGDFIGVEGELFETKVGERSVNVHQLKVLSKSLRPLPLPKKDSEGNEYDQFVDPEARYRQRYADLAVNPQIKIIFEKRNKLFSSMREYFDKFGYTEVETPILQSIPGGAAAKPFVTHHNALDIPLYLRIANELYLKRLIVGGFEGVYEFSKNFRNEGMDRTHNPEFTAMEIYVAYKDYNWMMDFTEKLLEKCAFDVNGSTKASFNGQKIDFKAPYPRITMAEAIKEHTGFDITDKSEEEIRKAAISLGLEITEDMGKGKIIDEMFGEKCESNYIQPTFITDYPVEMSPLCKKHRDNPELTERFELITCGKEIANAYSELNDPIDQRERFEEQLKLAEKGDEEASQFIDEDFLRALEYGMPPASGLGIGIDRLAMFLTDNQSIQEVLLFPQMKPEQKKIELTEDEKGILEPLQAESPQSIQELKDKVGLSNKKWDRSLKSLRKKELVEVEKTEEGIFVSVK